MPQSIKLSIDVGTDGLVQGLKVATKGVDQAAQQFRTSLGGMASASASAAKEHVGLLGTLKEFKTEQVQGARIARFYGEELASIIPNAGGASSAIQGLLRVGLEGAAGGFGIGLGIEVAMLALSGLADAVNRHEEKLKAVRKTATETWNSYSDAMEGVRQSYRGGQTEAMKAHQAQIEEQRKKVRGLWDEIKELAHDQGTWATIKDSWADVFGGGRNEEIEKKLAQIKKVKQVMSGPKAAAELASAQAVENPEINRRVAAEIRSISAATASEITRINVEKRNKLEELERDQAKYGEKYADLRVSIEAEAAEKIRRARRGAELADAAESLSLRAQNMGRIEVVMAEASLRIRQLEERKRQTDIPAEKARIDELIRLTRKKANDEADIIQQGRERAAAAAAADADRQLQADADRRLTQKIEIQKANEALVEASTSQWRGVGEAVGGAFAAMATGAANFGHVMAAVGKSVVGVLIDMATKAIISYSASAAGAAAFSQAGIPIIGPILATSAMAAMGALVMGLLSSLPSASAGYDIPAGLNPVTQLHQREMVLPAEYADVIRRMAQGGGAAGGVVFTINAIDGESVRRVLESSDFRRAFRELQRNGRI